MSTVELTEQVLSFSEWKPGKAKSRAMAPNDRDLSCLSENNQLQLTNNDEVALIFSDK